MTLGANTTSILPYYLVSNYLSTSPVKVEKMQLLKSGLVSQMQLLKDVKICSNQYPEPCFQQENAEGSKLGHQELTTDDIQSSGTFLPRCRLQLKMGRLGDKERTSSNSRQRWSREIHAFQTVTTCGYWALEMGRV